MTPIVKKKSDLLKITCGVPAGSNMGNLYFIIYINDLHNASNILNPITFADDANLFCCDKNITTLFQKVNAELKKVSEWFKASKLSINVD